MAHAVERQVSRMRALIGELKDDHWKSCCDLLETHHGDTHATYNLFFRDFFSANALPGKEGLASIYRLHAPFSYGDDVQSFGEDAEGEAGLIETRQTAAFPLDQLTTELALSVAQFLRIEQMLALSQVNRYFNAALSQSPTLWASFCSRIWRVPKTFVSASWRQTTIDAWYCRPKVLYAQRFS